MNTGGVAGDNSGTVLNCYATGTVSGIQIVAGVVGDNYGTLQNCFATGNVTGDDYVGGVVGYNWDTVRNCVALNPNISVPSGGIVGRVVGDDNSGTLANNYGRSNMTGGGWTSNASGNDGADVDASQYNSQSWWTTTSGLGWDFTNVWSWGGSLPVLRGMP